jgi:hypothetical protein
MDLLLSCISTKHSMLKDHWAKSEQQKQQTECPLTVLGSRFKPKEDQGGVLCLLTDDGQLKAQATLPMPAGMVRTDAGVLVASIYEIHHLSTDLSTVEQEPMSLPSFNMLHSLSRSKNGYLVASTGLDAILEFTLDRQLLWEWWATDHGFTTTPTGEPRLLEKAIDHRGVKYGTLAQTTHVNSTSELPNGTILATLFHQGMVIAIDRESGNWHPVLDGLNHPHSVRILNEDYITIADTGHGRGLLVRLKDGKGTIEAEVSTDTDWLQDCSYDERHDRWYLVDGKNTRIDIRTGVAGDRKLTEINLDPEWRLYEALPL